MVVFRRDDFNVLYLLVEITDRSFDAAVGIRRK